MLTHKVVGGKNVVEGTPITFLYFDFGQHSSLYKCRIMTIYNEHEFDSSDNKDEALEGLTSYYKEWGYDVTFEL